MSLSFLFWNIGRKPLAESVAQLARERDVDVLVLAESRIEPIELLVKINANHERKFCLPHRLNPRLDILVRLPPSSLQIVTDTEGVSIRHVTPPIGQSVLLVAVHLTSKLYMSDDELGYLATRLPASIEEAEVRVGHDRTIVIGDFNMNPYEQGLAGSEGLHAVMTRDIAAKGHRQVHGQKRRFFYNPMWGLFGDKSERPAGTYHFDRSGRPLNFYWNMFDQVLLRPSLLPAFRHENLDIITSIGEQALLSDGIPNAKEFSDHLPLFFRLMPH